MSAVSPMLLLLNQAITWIMMSIGHVQKFRQSGNLCALRFAHEIRRKHVLDDISTTCIRNRHGKDFVHISVYQVEELGVSQVRIDKLIQFSRPPLENREIISARPEDLSPKYIVRNCESQSSALHANSRCREETGFRYCRFLLALQ